MIEKQYSVDPIEQFMLSSLVVRGNGLPTELTEYHMRVLESPELSEVLQTLGLTVQSLLSLDHDTYSVVMYGLALEG